MALRQAPSCKIYGMNITKKDIADFQSLYKEKFNVELDYQTAYKKLTMLVRQMEIVYQPITKQQHDNYVKSHSELA